MVWQVISLIGAVLVLFSFAALQTKRIEQESVPYQLMNMIGGVCLCAAAIVALQYGFILLEGTWAILSAHGLWRVMRDEG
jgi:uncharacterized membrane protein